MKQLFLSLLTSGQYTRLVQPDVFVCERARDLRWDHGINLSGADAIHVASAIEAECGEFLTTDQRAKSPLRQAAALAALGLRVVRPSGTQVLPDEFRQERLTEVPPAAPKPPKARRRRHKRQS